MGYQPDAQARDKQKTSLARRAGIESAGRGKGHAMRYLAIGDIHGHADVLRQLLEFVQPRPEDRIITLGDYVDRGPDSSGVLDQLVALYATGQLIPLRGNHDVMML